MAEPKIILDLCGGTGAWSAPYLEDPAYEVELFDPGEEPEAWNQEDWSRRGRKWHQRVETVDWSDRFPNGVHGILMAPPCTEFASSGARWWASKDPALLEAALGTVWACMRAVDLLDPVWWVLENPVGRLRNWLGPAVDSYQPCDYGDPWTKKTMLWGEFRMPKRDPVLPTQGSRIHTMPDSKGRARRRSRTPGGFARAFKEANP